MAARGRTGGPARIALAAQGTRGDFQPILALGCGLARQGYVIKFFANPDHCRTAHEFGLEALACSYEVKDFLQTERGRLAMETGDFAMLAAATSFEDDIQEGETPDYNAIFWHGMSEFDPDILIWTSLIGGQARQYMDQRHDVPAFFASYQPHCLPTNHFGPIMMQRLEAEPEQPTFMRWVMAAQMEGQGAWGACEYRRALGLPQNVLETPQATYESYFQVEDIPTPFLLAYSKEWWPAADDWPKSNVLITGNWKIPKEDQEERVKAGSKFFNHGNQVEVCTAFIQADSEPPVYIGWGSMLVFSKGHMARLAVGALKHAKRRGIVVGGWAELSEESLDGAENSEELKAFARDHVLFMKAAPHEWLFPQCACCVHHGGIGTAQASLSSGSPTVVTPVFADQADIAEKINREKCGVGTVHLSKVTPELLGEAINKCCTDRTIIENVKALSQRMQKEDGVKYTVDYVTKFINEEVATGKWRKKNDERMARLRAKYEETLEIMKRPGMSIQAVVGMWNISLNEKFPVMKAYTDWQVAMYSKMLPLVKEKKLWWVKAEKGCLARVGETLKSAEAGRFREFAILEELQTKGSRMQVRRCRGIGPDTGWVTPVVNGNDLLARVQNPPEISKLQLAAVAKQFSDLGPAPGVLGQASQKKQG